MAWIELVAPRAGAWLETREQNPRPQCGQVAPRAGAWLETETYSGAWPKRGSRAPCGRVA